MLRKRNGTSLDHSLEASNLQRLRHQEHRRDTVGHSSAMGPHSKVRSSCSLHSKLKGRISLKCDLISFFLWQSALVVLLGFEHVPATGPE